MFTIVYTDVPLELQREILLRCSHDFLPRQYTEDSKFLKQWNETNKNVVVMVNGNEEYHVNFEEIGPWASKYVINNHYADGGNGSDDSKDNVGFASYTTYNDTGNVASRVEYKDNKKIGSWEQWYGNDDNQICDKKQYNDGEAQGLSEEWYINGNLMRMGNYVHNKQEGLWHEWYEDGQLKFKVYYNDGKMVKL